MYDPTVCRFSVNNKKLNPLKRLSLSSTEGSIELHLKWRGCNLIFGEFSEPISLSGSERVYLKSLASSNLKIEAIEAGILDKVKQAFKNISKKASALLIGLMLFAGTAKGGTALEKKAGELTNLYKKFATEQTYSEMDVHHKILKDSPNLKVVKWTFKDAQGKVGSIELTLTENMKDLTVSLDKNLDAGVYDYVQMIANDLKDQIRSP
jgi:hypothetical protein